MNRHMNNQTENSNERYEAIRNILLSQETCAAVTIQIGGVNDNNIVENDTLYIITCPPNVIENLRREGFKFSMKNGKLAVLGR